MREDKVRVKPTGFGRVMRMNESEAQRAQHQFVSEREDATMRLKEKYEDTPGLGLGNGKLDKMFDENPRKAQNLLLFLRETENAAFNEPFLVDNVKRATVMKESSLREADASLQNSSFLGVTPMDIVKIARIAYPNSVAPEMFDFWGMQSMKDSIYKLETLYGTTARGSTANAVTYESYGEGRYTSEIVKDYIASSSGTATVHAESATVVGEAVYTITGTSSTLSELPLRPFTVSLFWNDQQIAIDDGAGHLVGSALDPAATNVINYTSGTFTLNFLHGSSSQYPASGDYLYFNYNYNSENSDLFSQVGSVLLNLVVYDFRAEPWPLAIEWTRFTEELMASKLGMSAKEALIAGAADVFRKNIDEYCVTRAIKATKWTSPVDFNTDFSSAGSDSSFDHAQSVINAIQAAENLTYAQLGRKADKSAMVCDYMSANYLTKHRLFNAFNAPSKIGIHKVGELMGRDIYMAPPSVVNYDTTNKIGYGYIFGKGNDPMNVDACLSVGTWKAGVTTNPVELKNFNSQAGMANFMDVRVNNKYFAVPLTLSNLTANS